MCPGILSPGGPPPGLSKGGPGVGIIGGHSAVARAGANAQNAFNQCVTALSARYHEVVSYQPANRFWTFQTIETALFVVLAVALAGVCAWWIRHHIN